jgi:hypothetical protein
VEAKYGPCLYVARAHLIEAGNRPPRSIGTSASPLMAHLRPDHPTCRHGLTKEEYDTIRVWVETGCQMNGTHSAYKSWERVLAGYGVEPVTDTEGRVDAAATERAYYELVGWKPGAVGLRAGAAAD